ncbi:MAG: GNAT family N-acetyltransferase [Solirubrobacteraceae bacterium]
MRSLVWATDIDVLPEDHEVIARDGFLVVSSPSNPQHYWGNFLLLDAPPDAGAGPRWEALFDAEFGASPEIRHVTFAWDRTDGELGAAESEFTARGYTLERTVGLIAGAGEIRAHARECRDVEVRMLDVIGDAGAWEQVLEIQVASRDPMHEEGSHREFSQRRQRDLRALFGAGRGGWYVALDGNQVVGSCGVVVTGDRGRYQTVDTAEPYRRRGICSRLLVAAAHDAAARFGAGRFVIAADPDYHAFGLYESLGFRVVERVAGVMRLPQEAART